MKIVYDDIIYSLQKSGGISVYLTELSKRNNNKDVSHIAYDSAKNNIFYDESNLSNLKIFSSKFLFLKRCLNIYIRDIKGKFIFHSCYYRYCKNRNAINIINVHDFTCEYFRKDFKSILHKIQKKNAILRSDGILCNSEYTKSDLLKFYPNVKAKIKVTYSSYNSDNYKFRNYEVRTKNIIFVGARNSYKRFDLAVDITSHLENSNLVIVGGGELTKSEKNLLLSHIPGRYEKLNYVSDAELCELYNRAVFLCYPSDYEGFGIPLVEAQACGCPVVCQKNSCIPEVAGEGAVYFDANYLERDLPKIKSLFDKNVFKQLQNNALENAKRFSWDKCAKETFEFYEEIFNAKSL